MDIKGASVKAVPEFIKVKFPDQYQEWLDALPPESQKIFSGIIFTAGWYPLVHAVEQPSKVTADMFFNRDLRKACLEGGAFSAEHAAAGVYQSILKDSSPSELLSLASLAFKSYYQNARLKIVDQSGNSGICHITGVDPPSQILEWRTEGYICKALEIGGCKNLRFRVPQSLAKGDPVCEFVCSWD